MPKRKQGKKSEQTIQSVKDWLTWADGDYVSARILFLAGSPLLWFTAAWVAHEALEKYLKAILLSYGARVSHDEIWGHDLKTLARSCTSLALNNECQRAVFFSSEFDSALQRFDHYFNELRYPTRLQEVKGLGLEELKLLDNLVSILRPLVNFGCEKLPSTFEGMWPGKSPVDMDFVEGARRNNRFWGGF